MKGIGKCGELYSANAGITESGEGLGKEVMTDSRRNGAPCRSSLR